MKRIALAAVVLLVFTAGSSAANGQDRQFIVSIKPEIDIPLPPDHNLFKPGVGIGVSGRYVFPFFRPLSAGIEANYHLGRMIHDDMGNLGSLSVISVETTAELRLTLMRLMDVYLSGGTGYFYTFMNGEPSSFATNLVFSGRIGVGLRATPEMTICLHGEYRRYRSLYHLIGVGIGVDLWLKGVK